MATTHHIISYQIEIFDYRNTFLTLFLSRIYEMSTEFTLLIIPIFILLYSVGSFHSFHCFSYSYYRFGWNFFFFSRSDTPSCLSLQPSLTMLRVFFLLGIYLHIVFPLVFSAVSFPAAVSLFVVLLFTYFPLLILTPILHQNSLILYHGYLLFQFSPN